MKRYAILIGAEEYEDFPSTPYCHNDVDALYSALTKKCDYAEQDVLCFKLSIAGKTTPNEIIEKVRQLLERSEDGDSILFFYAGHGEAINGASFLILPTTKAGNKETTALPMRDVVHYLSKNNRLNIRVFDTCHSGQDLRSSSNALDEVGFTRSILERGAEGSITFASCGLNEKSHCDSDKRAGVFTGALVAAIAEMPVNSSIHPELLKIRVCESVEKWCVDNNKTQTPTYTAYVNGNVSIATRRPEILPTVVQDFVPQARSIDERLRELRSSGIVTPNEYPVLADAIVAMFGELESISQSTDFYGVPFALKKPAKCSEVPEFLEQRLVLSLKGDDPQHSLGSTREELYQSDWERLVGSPKKYVTHYYISQSSSQPVSFIYGESTTDGFVPRCGVFFYLCPLQASVVALAGHFFDTSYFGAADAFTVSIPSRVVFSIDQLRHGEHLRMATPLFEAFEREIKEMLQKRIAQLEGEADKLHRLQ